MRVRVRVRIRIIVARLADEGGVTPVAEEQVDVRYVADGAL